MSPHTKSGSQLGTIRTVIFDMGNVLINFSHEKACKQIAALAGRPADDVFKVLFASGLEMQYEAGQISRATLLQELDAGLGCKLDAGKVIAAACDIFWAKPDMEILAAGIKKSGYRMVLLSNVNEDHFDYIKSHYEFPKLFDDLVLSYQVGACKPDERIYQHAITVARCAAHECVFIDDVQENIDAAHHQGMRGITYKGTAELIKSLDSLGVRAASR